MKEKLIIRNFGPIKDVELELGKFNILIGENATGKSTVAKLLATCRYFSFIIEDNKIEQNFESGLESKGLSEFIQNNTYIQYECEHYIFTINRVVSTQLGQDQEGEYFEYDFPIFSSTLESKSKAFANLLSELEKIRPPKTEQYDLSNMWWTIPTSFFQNDVASVIDNPFYIPTERGLQSFFSLGKNSIQNISDSLFNQFARIDQVARSFKNETLIEPLNISYKNVDGKGFVKKNNEEKFHSLFNSASGYQSTIPVVLLVKYYSETRRKRKTFIIEEPELNLFPIAQKALINFLVESSTNFGHTIFLTTHSPYILTSLNNLMYAYEVGTKEPNKTNKIVNKKYWINPDDVSAYRLLSDGTAKKIISKTEDGTLIEADEIDEVSRQINKEFDELIGVDMINEENK